MFMSLCVDGVVMSPAYVVSLLVHVVLQCLVICCTCWRDTRVQAVPDVDIIKPCRVIVFALLYCLLDFICSECYCL